MAFDMTDRIMCNTAYGKAALKKMGDVSENFRIYSAGWVGAEKVENCHGMSVSGAEFRAAKTGPNKGKLTIKIEGSGRTTYLSRAEINAEQEKSSATNN